MLNKVLGAALAAAALALFAATFAPWFAHIESARLRDEEGVILALSGWELEGRIAALVLLAVFVGIGAGIAIIRRPRDPLVVAVCALAVLAGLAAAWAIGAEIRSPSDSVYNEPRVWVGVALAAALATSFVALLAALASLRQRGEPQTSRAEWPVIAGAAALYLLALGANASEVWQPQFLAACCAAGAIGYVVSRWWVAIVPSAAVLLILGLTPSSGADEADSLREVLYAFIALVVSAALLIGIGTRLLQRRLVRQQQV